MKIDYVFTYIDTDNEEWLKNKDTFSQYESSENSKTSKFNNKGFLKFFLRSLDKNLNWINNVYMVIPDRSHLPDWVDEKKVNIVEYKDIIPKVLIPTFNINTISLFLDNINGLSEHFIFGEDNQFINTPLKESDFFSKEDFLPILNYSLDDLGDNQSFIEAHNSRESLKYIEDYTVNLKSLKYIKLHNIPTPYINSTMGILRRTLYSRINKSFTKFKDGITNYNSHLYSNFNIDTYKSEKSELTFNNMDDYIKYEEICDIILNKKVNFLNIKNELLNNTSVQVVEDAFLKAYPDKCKYEK